MIDNLEEKLKGKLSVTRKELIKLVSSWGREDYFWTDDDDILIEKCEPKECYNLSNLDVSKIKNLSYIFRYSMYNGDLSKWDVSSCTNMDRMFSWSEFNNDSIKDWNISQCKNFEFTFANTIFDGNISKWIFKEKNICCEDIFYNNKNFMNKYNDGYIVPEKTKEFLKWFEANRTKISNLNVTKDELIDIDDYLSNFDNINKGFKL